MSNAFEIHDATLLNLWYAEVRASSTHRSAQDKLLSVAGWDKNWQTGGYSKRVSSEGGITVVHADQYVVADVTVWALENLNESASYHGTVGDVYAKFTAALQAANDATAAVKAHEANYTGWSRFYLVTSSNGLIHSSTWCSSCNKGRQSTTFALLPALSGSTFESAVDVLGPSLCSVCFSEAPTAVVDGPKIPARITSLLLNQDGQTNFFAELAKYNAEAGKREDAAAKRAATVAARAARRNSFRSPAGR